ncbi:MAG: methyltransferase, TIGR04325 family [Methanotrichaceae archaeon]
MKFKELLRPYFSWLMAKESMELYSNYNSAIADSDTYEDPDVVRTVSDKTVRLKDALIKSDVGTIDNRQLAQNLFVISYVCTNKPLHVLELGGACGATYFEVNRLLPLKIDKWYILETPSMAAEGKRAFQSGNIKFFDNLEQAVEELEHRDLLIAQGALQYTPDPLQTLNSLIKLQFDKVYLTRTVVGEKISRPLITKQVANLSDHGPGLVPEGFKNRKTSQPLTIVPLDVLKSSFADEYCIKFYFNESNVNLIRIASKIVETKMVGLLLERRT